MDNFTEVNDTENWDFNLTFDIERTLNDSRYSTWSSKSALWVFEAVFLGLVIVLTVAGNLLVIVGVACSPRLRSSTYYFIVNLAVADLLLGIAVLPISAARELFDYQLSPVVCLIWSSLDVLCCTASILSLCALAADRHAGVRKPLQVRSAAGARRRLASLWIVSAGIALVGCHAGPADQPCGVNKQLGYVIFSACGSFYIPALVMMALWWRVYRAATRRSERLAKGHLVGTASGGLALRAHRGGGHNSCNAVPCSGENWRTGSSQRSCEWVQTHQQASSIAVVTRNRENASSGSRTCYEPPCGVHKVDSAKRCPTSNKNCSFNNSSVRSVIPQRQTSKFDISHNRAIRTLALVVGGFMLCWCPFFIILPIDAACSTCDVSKAFTFSFWLGYFNSCINPFIYACSSREMRRAFRAILCRNRKRPILDYR
ncbi:alpha-1B adrenergic receptor-like [Arctopsyche grandis]|uniref:alpha-1B adrenergic receptor-like n=1 Tax=Arctopsyche grandis TaxID=121162 RepID=UPI00406DA3D3